MSATHFLNADLSYLKTYDMNTVQQAFNSIANDSQIEFNFPQGGCQQRAQIMSMLLDKKFNIEHCKVWLFPPVALYVGDARTLYIEDKNGLTPGNRIEWNYHVAPVVQVMQDYAVHTFVIDPSVHNSAPLLLNDWFARIGNSHVSKYSFLLPDKYFFYCCYTSTNSITTLFDGTFFNYENTLQDDLTMEKGLAINDMAMHIFHTYIEPLTASYNETDITKLEDLKEIFGNTTSLDMLFSQNISGYSANTKLRYAITHYSDIIAEAKNILSQRLAYWTLITNALL